MRYFLFYVLLSLPLLAKAGTPRDALPIGARATVSQAATQQAAELLQQLPTLSPVTAAARLSDLLKDRDLPRDAAAPWFDLIARIGGPDQLQQIYVGLVTAIADDCCEGRSRRGLRKRARVQRRRCGAPRRPRAHRGGGETWGAADEPVSETDACISDGTCTGSARREWRRI